MATEVNSPGPVCEAKRELIEDTNNSTNTILQEEKTPADTPKGPSTDEEDAFLKTSSADGVHTEVNYVSLHANMATEKPNQTVKDETDILLVIDTKLVDQPLDTAANKGTCSERIQENTEESNELWIKRDNQLENESKILPPTEASTKLAAIDKAKDEDEELDRVKLFHNDKNTISLLKKETDESVESLHVVPDNLKASSLSQDKEETSTEEQTQNMILDGITRDITEEKDIDAVEAQKEVLESLPMIVSCSPEKGNTDAFLQGNTSYGTIKTTTDKVDIEKEVLEVQNFSITSLNENTEEKHIVVVDVSDANIEEFLEKETEKVNPPQPLAREATDDESEANHEAVIVDGELHKHEMGENEKCTEADLQEKDSKNKKPEDTLNADSAEIKESYLGHIKETSSFEEQSETTHPRVIPDNETDEKYIDAAERNEDIIQVQDDQIFASKGTMVQNQCSENKNEENSEKQRNKPSSIKVSIHEFEIISSEEQSEIASSQIIQDQKTNDDIIDPAGIKEETLVVENVTTQVSNEKMEQVDEPQKKEDRLEENVKPSFSEAYLANANENASTATDEVKYDAVNGAEQLEKKSKESDILKKELQTGKSADSFPAVMEDTKPTVLGQEIERTYFPEDQCPTVNEGRILDKKTENETADPCDTEDKTQVQQNAVISVSNKDSERNSQVQYEDDKNSSIQLDASDMKHNIDLVKEMQEPSAIEASTKDTNKGEPTMTHETPLVDEHTTEVGLSDCDKTTDSTLVMKENLLGAPEDHKPSASSKEIETTCSLDEINITANTPSVINEKRIDKIDTNEEKLENVATKVPQEHTEEILVIQPGDSPKEYDEYLGKKSKTSFLTESFAEENNTVSESKDRNEDSINVKSWENERDTNTSVNEGWVDKHTDFYETARDDIQPSDSTQDTKINQGREKIQPPVIHEMPSGRNEERTIDANDKETLDLQEMVKNNLDGDTENKSLIEKDGTEKEVPTVNANDNVSPDTHEKNEGASVKEEIPIVSPETAEASALVKVEQVPPSDPQEISSDKSEGKNIGGYHEQEEVGEDFSIAGLNEEMKEKHCVEVDVSEAKIEEFPEEDREKVNPPQPVAREATDDESAANHEAIIVDGERHKHEMGEDEKCTEADLQEKDSKTMKPEDSLNADLAEINESDIGHVRDIGSFEDQSATTHPRVTSDGDTDEQSLHAAVTNEDILQEQEDQTFALTEKTEDNPLIQNQSSKNKNEENLEKESNKPSSIKDWVHEMETVSSEEQGETASSQIIQDQKTNNKLIDPAEIKEETLVVKNVLTTVPNVKAEEKSMIQVDGQQKKDEDHLEDNIKSPLLEDSLANASDNALTASDVIKLDGVNGAEKLEEKSREGAMLKQELHMGEPAESFPTVIEDTKPTDLGQDIERTDFPEDQCTTVAPRKILDKRTEKETVDQCHPDDKTQVQQNSEVSFSNEASERISLIQYEDSDKNSSIQLDASDMKPDIDLVQEMQKRSLIEASTKDINEGKPTITNKAAVVQENSREVGLSDGEKTTDRTLLMKENLQDAPEDHKSSASSEDVETTCPLDEQCITANPQSVINENIIDTINTNNEKLGNVAKEVPQEHTEEILVIQPGGSHKEHDEHLRKESKSSFLTESLTEKNNTVSESKDRNKDSIKVESWEEERDTVSYSVNEGRVEKHTDSYEASHDVIKASDSTQDTNISQGSEEIQNPDVQEMSRDRNEETANDANDSDTMTIDFQDIVKNNLDGDNRNDSLIKKDGTQNEVSTVKANDNVSPDTHEKSQGALIKEVIPIVTLQEETDDKASPLVKEKQVPPADPQEISSSKSEDKTVGGSHKQDEVVEEIVKNVVGGENENSPVKVDGLHEPSPNDASTGNGNDIDPPILSKNEDENSTKANLTDNERCAKGILATDTSEVTSQHKENKPIDATELEEGTLENKNIATTTAYEEAQGNSLIQTDCSQIEWTEQSENENLKTSTEAQKAHTTENALWKQEPEIEKPMDFVQVPSVNIKAPSSNQDTETSSIEQQDMTLNPQEIPGGKTEERSEEGTDTKGNIQEVQDIASISLNGDKENYSTAKVDGSQNPLLTESSSDNVFEVQDIATNVPDGDKEKSLPAKPDESEKPSAEALTGNINEVQDIEENIPSGNNQDLSTTKVDGSLEPYLAEDLTWNAAHHEPVLVEESSLQAGVENEKITENALIKKETTDVLWQATAEEIKASASCQDREPISLAEQSLVERPQDIMNNDREVEITCATDLMEVTTKDMASKSVAAEIPSTQVSDVNTNMVVDFSEGLNCKQEEPVGLNASEEREPVSNELVPNFINSTCEPSEQDSVTTDSQKGTVVKDGPTKTSENEGIVEKAPTASSSTYAPISYKDNKAEKKEEKNLNGEKDSSNSVTLEEVPSSNEESDKDLAPRPSLKPIKETWHEGASEIGQEQDKELHFSALVQDSSSGKIGRDGEPCPANVTDSVIPQEMQKLEEEPLPATDKKQTENEDWKESEIKKVQSNKKDEKHREGEEEEADSNDEKVLLDDTILETKVPELASISVEDNLLSKLIVSSEIDHPFAEKKLETNRENVQTEKIPTGDYKETEFEKKKEEANEKNISDFNSAVLNIIDKGDSDGANHSISDPEALKVIQTSTGANENLEVESISVTQSSASIYSCERDNYEHELTGVEEEPDANEVGFAPEESKTKHGVKNQVLETIEQVQSVEAAATKIVSESAMVEDISSPKEIVEVNISSQKIKDKDEDVQDDHLGSRKGDITERHPEDQVKQKEKTETEELFEFIKNPSTTEKVPTFPEGAIDKVLEDPEEIQAKYEVSPMYSANKSEEDATRAKTWTTSTEGEYKNSYVEAEVGFSSRTEDGIVVSNSDAAEGVREENKNSATINIQEKCANEERIVAELTGLQQPNVSGERHAAEANWKGPVSETLEVDEQLERTFEPSTKTREVSSQEKKTADYDSENFSESNVHQNSTDNTAQSDENQEIVRPMTSPPTLQAVKCSNMEIAAKDLAMGFKGTSVTELKVPTVREEAIEKEVEYLGEIYANDEISPMHSTNKGDKEEMRDETWTKPTEDEDKNTKVETEKVGFSSHMGDTTEVSNSDAAQEVPKYNENFTTTNKYYQEKCANEEPTGTVLTGNLEAKGSSDGQEDEANREDLVSGTLQQEIDEPQQQEIHDKPIVVKEDHTRNTNPETSFTAVKHGNIEECSLDEHELLKKSATCELEEKDYPKETSQTAYQSTHEKEPATHNEVLQTEKADEAEHEERKTDGEKDEEEEEESNEPGHTEVHSEAPVMVDAGDAEVKVVQKKSHNILSGVGSKVKHSIAKVKKAITGKSTHPKPPSPK